MALPKAQGAIRVKDFHTAYSVTLIKMTENFGIPELHSLRLDKTHVHQEQNKIPKLMI